MLLSFIIQFMHRTLIAGFRYAFAGIKIAWRQEINFRIEVLCAVVVFCLAIILDLSAIECSVLTITVFFVLAVEIFNTALEEVCDKFHPAHDPHIEKIKDLSAAAVLAASLGALCVGAVIFIPHVIGLVTGFDIGFENMLVAVREPSLLAFFFLVTLFAEPYFIAFVAVIVFVILTLRRSTRVLGFVTTLVGTAASVWVIKAVVHRPRPDELIAFMHENSFSFPSGHATGAVAFYGFLMYLAWKNVHNRILKESLLFFGFLFILAIGFSRLYLGVHFPSDVIAGYAIAGLWLLVGICF